MVKRKTYFPKSVYVIPEVFINFAQNFYIFYSLFVYRNLPIYLQNFFYNSKIFRYLIEISRKLNKFFRKFTTNFFELLRSLSIVYTKSFRQISVTVDSSNGNKIAYFFAGLYGNAKSFSAITRNHLEETRNALSLRKT